MNQATKLPQGETELAAFTVRAPESLWKAVRILAINRKQSAQDLWIQAMQEFLKRNAA